MSHTNRIIGRPIFPLTSKGGLSLVAFLPASLFGQLAVTDFGNTAPVEIVAGHTVESDWEFGFRPGNRFKQSFTLEEGITLASIITSYKKFDDFEATLTISVDAGNDGSAEIFEIITLDSADFSGNDANLDNTAYWMEWDFSSFNLELPAGEHSFEITLNSHTDPAPNSWIYAPSYSRANPYAGGQVLWNLNGEGTGGLDMMFAVTALPVTAPAGLQLVIRESETTPGSFDFEWVGQAGKLYDLVSSTDLTTDPLTWPAWNEHSSLEVSGDSLIISTSAPGDGLQRFFAVIEKSAP